MIQPLPTIAPSTECLSLIKKNKHWAPIGYLLSCFGLCLKVQDETTRKIYYISKRGLAITLNVEQGKAPPLAVERVLEVLNPVIGEEIKLRKIIELKREIGSTNSGQLIQKLETIRDRQVTKLNFNYEELKRTLKPGDILFHKCHEENANIISAMQRLFKGIVTGKKEREGHKYSHVAMYIGNGEVAEAVGPKGKERHVRILHLDDPRFALQAKNEYRVSRPTNGELGAKAAQVFRSFAKIIKPSSRPLSEPPIGRFKTLKYNFIEAVRSLWHPTTFDYFARQRYLKYYADYIDKKAPVQVIFSRNLFCSYAVSLAYQVADGLTERKISPRSLKEIVGEPPTNILNVFLRTIVRAVWSRYHAIVHRKAIDAFVLIKYDALRANPQDMRNFFLRNPKLFNDQFVIKNS